MSQTPTGKDRSFNVGKPASLSDTFTGGWKVGNVFFWYRLSLPGDSPGGRTTVLSVHESPADLYREFKTPPFLIGLSKIYLGRGSVLSDPSLMIHLASVRDASDLTRVQPIIIKIARRYSEGRTTPLSNITDMFKTRKS